jgi:hypothetical protein
MTEPTAARSDADSPDTRLAYHRPEVRDLGTLADLTEGGGSGPTASDGAGYNPSSTGRS